MSHFNLIITTLLAFIISSCGVENTLKRNIESIAKEHDLKLGFALYDFQTKETIQINADDRFPMQSVYKFPIAIATLDCIEKGEFNLIDTICVTKQELYHDIWSPISERYPNGVDLPISELILYMVAHSDNLATDIILEKIGSPAKAQQIIDSLGAKDIRIQNTESELQSSWDIQFENYATPNAMLDFVVDYGNGILLSEESNKYLWEILRSSSSGSVKRYIPEDKANVGYKTGFSGESAEGIIAAQNVVAIMEFENGKKVAFVIFITDSSECVDTGYDVIAKIGKAIFNSYL